MSHPVGRYWTWQGGPPKEGWELTRPIARIWYACDGGLDWPGDSTWPRATWTITDDDKRESYTRGLDKQDFDPMVWHRRLALGFEETERWLAWLGEPTPGSEYKWAVKRSQYDRLRADFDT